MKYLVFIFGLVCISACSKDEPVIPTPEEKLNFGNLKAGDELAFLRFESSCEDFQGDFRLTGDTLMWRVSSMEGETGVLTEKFTDHSPLSVDFPEVDLPVSTTSDFILIPDRWSSNLFFFYGNDTLWVDPPASVILEQEQCQLLVGEDDFRGDDIAFINQLKFQNFEFDNMTVVSCVPGSVRDAYIIYTDGKIKAIYNVDWFSGIPTGWISID